MKQSKEDIDKKFDLREHQIDRWGKLFLKVVGVGGAVIIAVILAYSQLKGHVTDDTTEQPINNVEAVKTQPAPIHSPEETVEPHVVDQYQEEQVSGEIWTIYVWSDGLETWDDNQDE